MKGLALVESRNHVCCRYRVRAFAGALADSGWSLAIEPLATTVPARLAQFGRLGEFDAVLLQRKLLPGWQLRVLRHFARRLIFDFDDAILYRDSYDPRGPLDARRARRFERTVRAADVVLAGNDFLADRARAALDAPDRVRLIPTCLAIEPDQTTNPEPRTNGLDLVWIGSSSTLAGLERQRPLWEHLGRSIPGLRLRLICDRFLRFESLPVVEIPWSEGTEHAEVAAGDVGIGWIPDDLWSRGKCGLKVLQYQAAGLPVVANPVGMHGQIIQPGIDGFLPTTAEQWVESIRLLADSAELRRRMGQAARASVRARYSVDAWAPVFVEAMAGDPASTAPRSTAGPKSKSWSLLSRDRSRSGASSPRPAAGPGSRVSGT